LSSFEARKRRVARLNPPRGGAAKGRECQAAADSFPVGEPGQINGLVSLAQIKHCPPDQRAHRRVCEIMRPADAAVQIAATASVSDALRHMLTSDSSRLLVTDADRVIGLITLSGLMRFIQLKTELEEEEQ
jgi:predicted transcriptional regulator